MSTFRAFQTGLEAGQQQAKVRRQDDARKQATEAYGMGNYEGAVTGLMGAGMMDEANAYGQMGERRKAADRTESYATALGSAPDRRAGYQAVGQAAAKGGDFATMQAVDEALARMDKTQAEQFGQGMEFLGNTALGLKGVPPEARGQAAMEILQNSPYANPQILQQIQQAAADGRITDEELDNFAQQTMSVAERVKLQREGSYTLNPGDVRFGPNNERVASAPRLPPDRAPTAMYRPATAEEKVAYNLDPKAPAKFNLLTNEVEIIPNANASTVPKPTPMQVAVDKNYAADLVEWQTTGSTNFLKNVRQLDAAVNRLESGEELSGVGSGVPGRDVWGQAGRAVQQQVEEVIQSSLREVLGAQFTQKEGEGILARTYDPMQEEGVNAGRVRALLARLKLAAEQKNAALEYYNANGTMAGYTGRIPTISDFEAAASGNKKGGWAKGQAEKIIGMANAAGAQNAPAAKSVPDGIDPEDWQFMTPEQKALFQ